MSIEKPNLEQPQEPVAETPKEKKSIADELSSLESQFAAKKPQGEAVEQKTKEGGEKSDTKKDKEKEAKEKERQELEKTVQEKRKELDDRRLSLVEVKSKVRDAEREIVACDKAIEQAELGMRWLERTPYFDRKTHELVKVIRDYYLPQAEKEQQGIVAKKPSRKFLGLREDKASKDELEQEKASATGKIENLRFIQEMFNRSGDDDSRRLANLTNTELISLLQQEVGQSSEYKSYKFDWDELNEIAKKQGFWGVRGKTEKDLSAEKEAQEKVKKELEFKKQDLEYYISHTEKEDLPKREKEIEELRQKTMANK